MLISNGGTVIRMSVTEVKRLGRSTQGVIVMRLREGEQVVALAPVVESDDDTDPLDTGAAAIGTRAAAIDTGAAAIDTGAAAVEGAGAVVETDADDGEILEPAEPDDESVESVVADDEDDD
jgi:DNA gyrase/topoisomerase IV subunit A